MTILFFKAQAFRQKYVSKICFWAVSINCLLWNSRRVSFAIARIRTPHEPIESAWSYSGDGYVDQEGHGGIEDTCGKTSGCQTLERPGLYGGDEIGTEHLAGPGCISGQGYSGYQISVEEMKGCRVVQCLMKKTDEWEAEDDDQDFELESNYFLTGLGNGSPDESPLEDITPARHGVEDLLITNIQIVSHLFAPIPLGRL
jgi:hypothetical protein